MKKEVWGDIDGYEGRYQVSTNGRIKSLPNDPSVYIGTIKKEKILKTRVNKFGYVQIFLPCLKLPKRRKGFLVHRLMAIAFIKNPKSKPCVNHINGIKNDNSLSNLEWCTHKENAVHARENGLSRTGDDCLMSKLKKEDIIEIRKMYSEGVKQKEIAKKFRMTQGNCHFIVTNKTWKNT